VSKKQKIKTLLIGCGRIGAGSGGRNQRSSSHAGALADNPAFASTLYDSDLKLSKAAGKALELSVVDHLQPDFIESLDCAVICSPTKTHFKYLSTLLRFGTPLIVCEKPVCSTMAEVQKLKLLKKQSVSRVVLNYTRRFQPSYAKLKKRFAQQMDAESVRAISLRYQRGFLNNASHALDLIQFLTSWNILDAKIHSSQSVPDEFPDDPTLSGIGSWNGAQISILGLPHVRFSLFEIDFYFERTAFRLRDRGDTVEFADSDEPSGYYAPLATKKLKHGNMSDPLKNLYRHVAKMACDPAIPDNFDESLKLTDWILQIQKKA